MPKNPYNILILTSGNIVKGDFSYRVRGNNIHIIPWNRLDGVEGEGPHGQIHVALGKITRDSEFWVFIIPKKNIVLLDSNEYND